MRFRQFNQGKVRRIGGTVLAGSLLGVFWGAAALGVMIIAMRPPGPMPFGLLTALALAGGGGLLGVCLFGMRYFPGSLAWPRKRPSVRWLQDGDSTVCLEGTVARVIDTPRGSILLMRVDGQPYLISYPGTAPVAGGTCQVYGKATDVLIAADRIKGPS